MNNTMIQNSCNDSYVQVTNYGGYFAEFYVSYISNGQPIKESSGVFALGETRKIQIEPGTEGVLLQIDVWFLSAPKTIYNKYIETYTSDCFRLYGSIFNPSVAKVDCTDDDPPCYSACCNCCNAYNVCQCRNLYK
ncbi:hypothetical protein [Clostridium botulinum]|uniref:Uncharacterized protein n=1 Tax=Clostridium botulinum TaxID=1491 RepID=A0A9Q1UYR3_CLOBO|nr:hypothetical protein [Clostridium botulinum]AEB75583.1 hypothetical protein CbC4_0903 [Clostridium botulinum BKT015925]KEI04312.1 hypothetical protein Y848_02105 [Clostridium botulinum C/D str. Sp77]KLU75264.1 hypothetical protein CBC3_09740 [Clostridium botulinum V891]KOA76588.1 hypothetical protein ADU77_08975 [Clostridium botulinum]KOA78480.1 hypothetical protein ADU78_01780 [Clostridium botulinum]